MTNDDRVSLPLLPLLLLNRQSSIYNRKSIAPPGSPEWRSAILDVSFRFLGILAVIWVIHDARRIVAGLGEVRRAPVLEVCVVVALGYLLAGAGGLVRLALRSVLADGVPPCNETGVGQ